MRDTLEETRGGTEKAALAGGRRSRMNHCWRRPLRTRRHYKPNWSASRSKETERAGCRQQCGRLPEAVASERRQHRRQRQAHAGRQSNLWHGRRRNRIRPDTAIHQQWPRARCSAGKWRSSLLKTGINTAITVGESKSWKFHAGEGHGTPATIQRPTPRPFSGPLRPSATCCMS